MNKTVIGVIVVLAVAIVGYLFLGAGPGEEPVATAPVIEEGTDAAADTAEAAADAVEDTTGAVTDITATAAGAASDAVADTAEAAGDAMADLGDLLTVDKFDFDRVIAAIETSDIGDDQKATLTSALDLVRDSPEQLEGVLQQVRDALNL